MTRVGTALFNCKGGCLRSDGGYDFRRLQRALAQSCEPVSCWDEFTAR